VTASTGEFIERALKLRVNLGKSSVASACRATLLGFGFLRRDGEIKIGIDPKARKRAKDRCARSHPPAGASWEWANSRLDPHVRWYGRGRGKPPIRSLGHSAFARKREREFAHAKNRNAGRCRDNLPCFEVDHADSLASTRF